MCIRDSNQTTHYSIVDQYGNAVSVTTTLNADYGSKLFVEENGFFLNNEMDDFSIKPGVKNMYGLIGSDVNKVEPNKRMLSSMTPTIIEEDGELALVLGSPGGPKIITTVLQVILNIFEFGMGTQQAVDALRFHHQFVPEEIYIEPGTFKTKTIKKLKEKGYLISKKRNKIGRVDAIRVMPSGGVIPAADKRGDAASSILN